MHKNSCPLHPCTLMPCTLYVHSATLTACACPIPCSPHTLYLSHPHILYLHPLDCVPWIPHILHPVPLTPCNLHLIPYTLHPCPALCTLHPFAYWKMIGFPLTPFQILNSIQSWNCKLSLLVIKVPKAPFPHVFKSSALPKLMTKLTLNEPAITENRKVKSMHYITSYLLPFAIMSGKTGRLFNLKKFDVQWRGNVGSLLSWFLWKLSMENICTYSVWNSIACRMKTFPFQWDNRNYITSNFWQICRSVSVFTTRRYSNISFIKQDMFGTKGIQSYFNHSLRGFFTVRYEE